MRRSSFFFFGTLLDSQILEMVAGRRIPARQRHDAILEGYRRVYVKGRHFPIVVPAAEGRVPGIVVIGLDRRAIARIDDFEDDGYRRTWCPLRLPGGGETAAWVYLTGPGLKGSGREWDFETWRRRHRAAFFRRVSRWMAERSPVT